MPERTHAIMILSNLWRIFFLIIIPVIRGFLSALQLDFFSWIRGAWIDILIFLFMISISVLQWLSLTYRLDKETITVRSGVLFKRTTHILWDRVTAVSMVESFYLRPFRAVHLRADTMGGSYKRADLSIFLKREKAIRILDFCNGDNHDKVIRQYVPTARSVLAMSLLNSNSLAGILFISAFVSQSGKLLGNEFSDMIVSTFEELTRKLAFGIPPAAAAIAYILLGGWVIGFLFTFISYRDFVIRRRNSTLSIQGGAVTFREYSVRYDQINFIDIRQNALAKIFRLYSLYISVVGYGKVKDDISCIIPTEYADKFTANRQMLFPDFLLSGASGSCRIKSPGKGILRFISQPLSLCAAIPLALFFLTYLFPSWFSFISFTCLMLLIPSVLFLVVRIIAFFTGGISREGAYYTLRYSSGFSLHTVIIPESKIIFIGLRQSIIQIHSRSNTCDLIIQTVAEGRARHMCRNLPKDEVEKLLENININPI